MFARISATRTSAIWTSPGETSAAPTFPRRTSAGRTLERYNRSLALYIVGDEIEPNDPVVSGGTPTAYSVTPDLPAGLSLDTTTGRITGTPETESEPTDYFVTATFSGDRTDEAIISIEVKNPFVRYPVTNVTFKTLQAISPLKPTIFGPEPSFVEIEPDLPPDLVIDVFTGEISGTPFDLSPETEYRIFVGYDDFPEAETTIFITVIGVPELLLDPPDLLNDFVSVGEFNTDGPEFSRASASGWGGRRASARPQTTCSHPFAAMRSSDFRRQWIGLSRLWTQYSKTESTRR